MDIAEQFLSLPPEQMLAWQMEMGADECILDTPLDYFEVAKEKRAAKAETPAAANNAAPISTSASQPADISSEISKIMGSAAFTTPSPAAASQKASNAAAIAEARELADKTNTLDALREAVMSFKGCDLHKTAKNVVFSDGNAQAETMFIGEAPGADEDAQGIPFCGKSGQLLDEMLGYIGLYRHDNEAKEHNANFYISNTIFWRPPANRKPTAEEIAICQPFVEKHIALINPKRIICVGGTSAQALLKQSIGITRLRGKEFTYKNDYMENEIPAFVFLHPAYLLRQPLQKKNAWRDMLALKMHLNDK